MSDQSFHFTLGPVQGFVAQARRTRDFWAGSFLLSWLAGAAMLAVKQQGGKIDFPAPDEDYLKWLTGEHQGPHGPRQGCIPNRFKAIRCKVPESFNPLAVEQAVRSAWRALAEAVWRRDLERHEAGGETRAIWERQIEGFWDIAWALGEDNSLLDRRKNWRTWLPPEEAGVKCSMMAGWQELSGAAQPGDERLGAFWEPLRESMPRDLDEAERLCAIAFVKRRFAGAFAEVRETFQLQPSPLTQAQGGRSWTLHGWRLEGQMPSTLDLAAAPWVARLSESAELQAASAALVAASPLLGRSDRGLGLLRCVREHPNRDLAQLHSSTLFAHVLDNSRLCPERAAVKAMRHAIKALGQGAPSPFYAILLMDGDSLGQLLREEGAPARISTALNAFTARVPERVDAHNGVLVYAGGDDVLALLPLEDALGCAAAIRADYLAAFKAAFGARVSPSTLSAAITFAHVKTPLTRLLHDSHQLLDEVAKDASGRDALAVRVVKPSGTALQWARPWACALDPERPERLLIERLAEQFAAGRGTEDAEFSSKFFYRIRERFDFLNPAQDQPEATPVFSQEEAVSLLAVDYLASGVNRKRALGIEQAEARIRPLLEQCYPVRRYRAEETTRRLGIPLSPACSTEVTGEYRQLPRLEADAALLVRFLAQKGVES